MARIRTIKPEFFRHEGLFEAELESGLPLRVAFVGLWTASDRDGRFNWRPRQLKLDCLPYDDVDFSRVLDALMTRGFIVKYAEKSEVYGFIPSWPAHQFVNNREAASTLPPPSDSSIESATSTREARVDDAEARADGNCVKGRERKGKEGERNKAHVKDASPTAPSDVGKQVFADWAKQRKAQRAAVSETAIEELRKEALKAGLTLEAAMRMQCQKGWRGFDAAWVDQKKKSNGSHGKQAALEEQNAQAGEEWLRRHPPPEEDIFDAIATERQG